MNRPAPFLALFDSKVESETVRFPYIWQMTPPSQLAVLLNPYNLVTWAFVFKNVNAPPKVDEQSETVRLKPLKSIAFSYQKTDNILKSIAIAYQTQTKDNDWFIVCDEGDCHLFNKNGNEIDISKIKTLNENIIPYDIKKIIIPDSVKNIEKYAFYDCENLTSIFIPDSVKDIGNCAFYGCKNQ